MHRGDRSSELAVAMSCHSARRVVSFIDRVEEFVENGRSKAVLRSKTSFASGKILEHVSIYRNGVIRSGQLALEELIPVANYCEVDAGDLCCDRNIVSKKSQSKVHKRERPATRCKRRALKLDELVSVLDLQNLACHHGHNRQSYHHNGPNNRFGMFVIFVSEKCSQSINQKRTNQQKTDSKRRQNSLIVHRMHKRWHHLNIILRHAILFLFKVCP